MKPYLWGKETSNDSGFCIKNYGSQKEMALYFSNTARKHLL